MKICVFNGSPKGKYSITIQTVIYLEKKFPNCDFEIINVGQKIKMYEKDMTDINTSIENADLLLFSYPVYTFIAPSQLHRFIELLKSSNVNVKGKYAAQITTSKHFYDVTAHEYIKQNCLDMELKYLGGLSADMDDLLSEKGRKDAINFWNYIVYCAEHDLYETSTQIKAINNHVYNCQLNKVTKDKAYNTVIVTNCETDDISLNNMIEDFNSIYPSNTKVINIAEYPFSGGCLGCFNCAGDGKCIYKDGFDTFLREQIQTADAIVYAFSIKDHSMGATFKKYDDRQFCNGHRTVTMGMPVGYIINGDYAAESNLKMIIEGRCEVGHNYLAGCANNADELKKLSQKLIYALDHKLVLPQNFLGVGGMKIFRDLIYLMRGLMKADHKFYKKHGIYDFPQKKIGLMLKMKFLGGLVRNPKIKAKMGNKMNEGMIAPYKKVIDKN